MSTPYTTLKDFLVLELINKSERIVVVNHNDVLFKNSIMRLNETNHPDLMERIVFDIRVSYEHEGFLCIEVGENKKE